VGEGPDFLDPALAYAPSSWSILTMTNDGLVGFRRVGGAQGAQLVADLAVSLPTPSDGGTTYTFQLRPGIRYSDGKLVQPDDFRRELERVFEVRPASAGIQFYGQIVGAARCASGKTCNLSRGIVTDRAARTVTFHLTAPDADFLTKLALPFAFAVPAGTPAHDVGTHAVPATGPYMVAAYRPKQKTLRLVRNRNFRPWSADAQPQGYPDAISWSWPYGPADAEAQVRAVERGAADIAPSLAPPLSKQQLGVLAVHYPSQLHMTTAASNTRFFFLNTLAYRRSTTCARDAPSTTPSTARRSRSCSGPHTRRPARSCRQTLPDTGERAPTSRGERRAWTRRGSSCAARAPPALASPSGC
jgi:peptide/nickel transport system substrate-binding protein